MLLAAHYLRPDKRTGVVRRCDDQRPMNNGLRVKHTFARTEFAGNVWMNNDEWNRIDFAEKYLRRSIVFFFPNGN